MPIYVLVVPLVWLLAMTPADAIAMGVVGDVARPIVGVIATALLVWRDYRVARERLFAGAALLIGVLFLGHDESLMILAGLFLVATFVRWILWRPGGDHVATPLATPGHAR